MLAALPLGFTVPLTLICVCLGIFIAGRLTVELKKKPAETSTDTSSSIPAQQEGERAVYVVENLDRIAEMLRHDIAAHDRSLQSFKEYVDRLDEAPRDSAHTDLTEEAREVLKQTTQLGIQITKAFEEIHQNAVDLVTLAGITNDPLSNVQDGKSLDTTLRRMFAMRTRYEVPFSLVTLKADRVGGENNEPADEDTRIEEVGKLVGQTVRETDVVARYGTDYFVVVMPFTQLHSTAMFAERLREMIRDELQITVRAGVATAEDADDAPSLLRRTVKALEGAMESSDSAVFFHDGESTKPSRVLDADFSPAQASATATPA